MTLKIPTPWSISFESEDDDGTPVVARLFFREEEAARRWYDLMISEAEQGNQLGDLEWDVLSGTLGLKYGEDFTMGYTPR